jgi:hypothetical protein
LDLKEAISLLFLLYKARTGLELSLIIGGFFFLIFNRFLLTSLFSDFSSFLLSSFSELESELMMIYLTTGISSVFSASICSLLDLSEASSTSIYGTFAPPSSDFLGSISWSSFGLTSVEFRPVISAKSSSSFFASLLSGVGETSPTSSSRITVFWIGVIWVSDPIFGVD